MAEEQKVAVRERWLLCPLSYISQAYSCSSTNTSTTALLNY